MNLVTAIRQTSVNRIVRRWPRLLATATGVAVLLWGLYKTTTIRAFQARATVDTGCGSDPKTVADLSTVTPGAAPVRCQPWDVGTGVAGYVWHAPNPKAVVLIEHGWGDYSQRYVAQGSQLIPHLLAHGISVYAIDMWGNGRSPGTRGATDIGDAVDDHLAARRRLRDQPLPVFVLGHSVGGLVTATSTLRDRHGVRGMVLIAPALSWGLSGFMRAVGRTGGFLLPTFAVPGPPGDPSHQSRDTQFLERVANDPLYYSGKVSWATAGSGATTSHKNWKDYEQLAVPILLVTGTDDKVTPPAGAGEFIATIGSRDKTLHLVEGGRHSLLDDPPAGAEALHVILRWLDLRASRNSVAKP